MTIHVAIKRLISNKSKRDNKKFTIYQLAKEINMPHSILVKLLHDNPEKRVKNPKIDTLLKIVDFFRKDRFDVTLDDLFCRSQVQTSETSNIVWYEKSIPFYSFDSELDLPSGVFNTKLIINSENLVALISTKDIKPMFKKGSIFIIDTKKPPKNNTLVVFKSKKGILMILKLYENKGKKLLKSYEDLYDNIDINEGYIVGVVVQVNPKI